MIIRKAEARDLPRMMEIYANARAFMASHGNPNQWGATNWPPERLIRQDISEGNSYVCLNGAGRVVGVFFFICGEDVEPAYRAIEDGAWLDDSAYGVVHRIASDGSEKLDVIVEEIDTRQAVGYFMLRKMDSPFIEFTHVIIGRKGLGYGREALNLLLEWTFKVRKYHRVWIDLFSDIFFCFYLYY